MGQLLMQYEGVWPIGTLPIETSPDPFTSAARSQDECFNRETCIMDGIMAMMPL